MQSVAKTIQRGATIVVTTLDTAMGVGIGRQVELVRQTHDRLEEVVVPAHFEIEMIEHPSLLHSIQAIIAEIAADQGEALLLHEAGVVLVPGAIAGELDGRILPVPEGKQVVVEELGAVVSMEF